MGTLLGLAIWIASIILCRWIGSKKNRASEGMFWGIVFGPIAIVIIALRGRDTLADRVHADQVLPREFE